MNRFDVISILTTYRRIKNWAFTFIIKSAFHSFGKRSSIEQPIRIAGAESILIGDNVFIGSDSWLETMSRENSNQTPIIEIREGTSISGHCTITATKSVIIENDVLIARYAYISDHSHAFQDRKLPIVKQGINKVDAVRISQGAWLGQNVIVCPGVSIGKNSVIGANSVVTKSIPDYSVAVGSPARVVRKI